MSEGVLVEKLEAQSEVLIEPFDSIAARICQELTQHPEMVVLNIHFGTLSKSQILSYQSL